MNAFSKNVHFNQLFNSIGSIIDIHSSINRMGWCTFIIFIVGTPNHHLTRFCCKYCQVSLLRAFPIEMPWKKYTRFVLNIFWKTSKMYFLINSFYLFIPILPTHGRFCHTTQCLVMYPFKNALPHLNTFTCCSLLNVI